MFTNFCIGPSIFFGGSDPARSGNAFFAQSSAPLALVISPVVVGLGLTVAKSPPSVPTAPVVTPNPRVERVETASFVGVGGAGDDGVGVERPKLRKPPMPAEIRPKGLNELPNCLMESNGLVTTGLPPPPVATAIVVVVVDAGGRKLGSSRARREPPLRVLSAEGSRDILRPVPEMKDNNGGRSSDTGPGPGEGESALSRGGGGVSISFLASSRVLGTRTWPSGWERGSRSLPRRNL